MVGQILELMEQVERTEQPKKYAAVKVEETAPGQICFLLEDAALSHSYASPGGGRDADLPTCVPADESYATTIPFLCPRPCRS